MREALDPMLYRGAPLRLRGRHRVVRGVRMYERSAPRAGAPVVVLVHGVGVSGRYFLPTAGRLAERASVHVPDLPGFGRSGRHPTRLTTPRLADALEAWLDAAGLERPDALVANSFGCQIALDVVREPLALWGLQAYDYAVHLRKSGLQAFTAMVDDAPEEKLARVTAPTLVVRGARDPIVPRRWAEELTAGLPDGRLEEIRGAPHAVNYSAPGELARLVFAFLERVSSSSAGSVALQFPR